MSKSTNIQTSARLKSDKDSEKLADTATLRRVLEYIYPQSFFLLLSIIGFAIYAATQPLSAVLIEWLIKTLDGEMPRGEIIVPAAFVTIAIIRGIGTYMGSYYITKVAERMVEAIRKTLFENVIHLPLKVFDDNQSGKLVSLFTYNSVVMSNTTARSVTIVAQEGLTVIALLAYLVYANWQFTSMFIVLAPPIALVINWAGKRIKKFGQDMQNSMADLNGVVSESFSGIRLVKSVAGESKSNQLFSNAAGETRKLALKIAKVNSIYTPTMQIMIACAMALVVVLVINTRGEMDTAQLIAYVTAAALLSKPIRSLSNVHLRLTQASVAAAEIFSYIDQEKECNNGELSAKDLKGDVEFRNVNFRYSSSKEPVISNLSLEIKQGETVALVGKSGGGKSTLANLIPRFYDIENGSIEIDGVDVNKYELASLRQNIAIVSQQVILFNTSVAENIAYGSEGATQPDIELAARQANAHDFITSLPDGYETNVGENGTLLSGGQRQRIAIARAFLRRAPIMILDEATSALDNESEAKVQHALDKLIGQSTTLVIAHRLSTIENADRILVIDKGSITQTGNHESLKHQEGLYSQMLARDFD